MNGLEARHLVGLDYLQAVTTLLQRVRSADPVKGLYEAADMQWWWGRPRPTDSIDQLFWFDESEMPVAAAIITQWKGPVALDPMVMPDADPEFVAEVFAAAITHAAAAGYRDVELEVDRADEVLQQTLTQHGFSFSEESMVEAWIAAGAVPEVSALHEGYRLATRAELGDQPHHMVERNGPHIAERLLQTSLYRTDLELIVLDSEGNYAADCLCWFDPVTATGLVEPLGTEEPHRRKGLARHVLTAGLNLLAQAGAERIKIVYELSNPGSSRLYPDVGFVPAKYTDAWSGKVA